MGLGKVGPRGARAIVIAVTIACAWVSAARLSLSGDLTSLFPDQGDAAALGRFTRSFGGGDFATVLVRGEAPDAVEAAAGEIAATLAAKPTVERVALRIDAPERALDPTLAWSYAGPDVRARLAAAVTPEGMRARLDETRALLLAPGAGEAETWLARDPLRLAQIPWEGRSELAAGLVPGSDGSFVADGGRARLVVVQPRGSAFDSRAAGTFVADAEAAMTGATTRHPGVRAAMSGGHAIAQATEAMIRRDLEISATLSLVLASVVFLAMFRRARALLAVMPPLVVGTVWTMGVVAVASPGLTAISIGFMAVVVGVGVDTGVHVYSALLDARRAGLSPPEAARAARAKTARPTLLAAVAAGMAFASLALSDLGALRQLGVLCALGEILTAIAILVVTPDVGALLERGPPPPPLRPAWLSLAARATGTKRAAAVAFALALVPVVAVATVGWPRSGDAVVALRPHGLAPLVTQDEIYALFGGERGQWVVLIEDPDAERAAARGDRVADALATLKAEGAISGYDALGAFAPAPATQRDRLAARDALDLPSLAPRLEAALVDRGFDLAACEPALDAFRHPSSRVAPLPGGEGALGWIVTRHLVREPAGALVAIYVRPRGDEAHDDRATAAIKAADPGAAITGYTHLEAALKRTLAEDLPRVALVALVLVAITLRAALTRLRDVGLAILTVVVELSLVAGLMRILHLRWHVYDALVLPVLVGITIDEAMFLLHAARDAPDPSGPGGPDGPDQRHRGADPVDHALRTQGPLVASTALTTAAGFGALMACQFEGLSDLGAVGAIGSVAGLVCALVLVPAGLRLASGIVR